MKRSNLSPDNTANAPASSGSLPDSLDKLRSCHGGYWRYPGVLDFHYLCNPYFPSPELYQELQQRLVALTGCYPSSQRVCAELLAKWDTASYFTPQTLVVGNGSSELIRLLGFVLERCLVPIPTFNEWTRLPGDKLELCYLRPENNFAFDCEYLLDTAKAKNCSTVIVCNPNNPVGNIVPREGIIKLLNAGLRVVVDEAFIDFSAEHSCCDLLADYERLVVVTTCTKNMGIAGLRLGYLISRDFELVTKLRDLLPIWNVSSLAEHFLEIFPRYQLQYQQSIERTVSERGEFFTRLQKVPFLEPMESHANFVFCRTEISARRVAEALYSKSKILVKDGLNQSALKSDNYLRFGMRSSEENELLFAALSELGL